MSPVKYPKASEIANIREVIGSKFYDFIDRVQWFLRYQIIL